MSNNLKIVSRNAKQLGFLNRAVTKLEAGGVVSIHDTTVTGSAAADSAADTAVSVTIPISFPTDALWARVIISVSSKLSYTRGAAAGPLNVRSTIQPVLPGTSIQGVCGMPLLADLATFTDYRLGNVTVEAFVLSNATTGLDVLSTLHKFGATWDADTSAVTYAVDINAITQFFSSPVPTDI